MHKHLGKISLGQLLQELKDLPESTHDIPVRIEDDGYGEQSNIRLEVVTKVSSGPRLILGWYAPGEESLIIGYDDTKEE